MCYLSRACSPGVLSLFAWLMLCAPALAVTGNASPAVTWAARPIVMIVDARGDLCTGTALARDLVLTAAHCVNRPVDYTIKPYQTGVQIPVRTVVRHPPLYASYAASRATADIALLKLAAPLPDVVVPATLAAPPPRCGRQDAHHCWLRCHVGRDGAWARPSTHGDFDGDRQSRLVADPAL